MIDYYFRLESEAGFASDLDAFCAAGDYEPISIEGETVPSSYHTNLMFFAFDVFEMGGVLHANARMGLLPNLSPNSAARAPNVLQSVIDGLEAWFSQFLLTNSPLPPAYPDAVPGNWHMAPGGTALILPAPLVIKRVWA